MAKTHCMQSFVPGMLLAKRYRAVPYFNEETDDG
jgi:hypothetical protein